MKKVNYGYIPANMPGGPTMNNSYRYNNKILGWWNKDCIISYPKILMSAYHLLNSMKAFKISSYDELKKYFNIDENIFILLDSGGFSMSTLGDIDITPKQIIDMSIAFNADIMMSLDIPPYNLLDEHKPFNLPIEGFTKKMEISYQNAKFMSENRQDYKGKYYVCIHGDNSERLELWWNKHKNLKFDGVALSPKDKSDYWVLAQTLLWIHDKGVKENVHFLAFSGVTTIPILVYFTKFIKNLTYDSSSWAGGAMRREYVLPFLKEKIIYGHSTNYDIDIPCNCQLCSQMDSMKVFHDKSQGGALMSMHNLLKYEEFDRMLHSLVRENDLFRSFVKTHINSKILDVLDYIDFGIEHGLEKANAKYKRRFKEESFDTKKLTLYDF